MNRKEWMEDIAPLLGGLPNISREEFRNENVYITLKDTGIVDLHSICQKESVETAKLSRGRMIIEIKRNFWEDLSMVKNEKYLDLSDKVIDLLGGEENITFFTHCVTRLRFNVNNKESVKKTDIDKIDGVLGCQWSGNQFQIIIGQSVSDAYSLICEKHGFSTSDQALENIEQKDKKKFSVGTMLEAISGSIAPIIPVIMGAGLIKVIVLLLQTFQILDSTSPTYTILNALGDAGYYFLPVFLGGSAAKKFRANTGLGMMVGAFLIHPSLLEPLSGGTLDLFGIPVFAASYSSSIFPVILTIAVMAPIEKFISKHSPDIARTMLEPLLTLLIIAPIAICLTGPIGALIGNYLSAAIMGLYNIFGGFAIGILAAVYPLMVLTGMHSSLTPYMVNAVAMGGDFIVLPAIVISNFCEGAAAAAVAVKTKDMQMRANATSGAFTAIVAGVTEPALFGINLQLKTPLIGAMVGGLIGGMIMGITNVCYYVFGGSGLFAFPSFISDTSTNLFWAIACCVIGIVVTFVTTLILYKPESENK